MFFIHRNHLLTQELIKTMADLASVIAQLSTDVQANAAAVDAAVAVLSNPPAGVTAEQVAALEAIDLKMQSNTKVLHDAVAPPVTTG